MWDSFDLAWAKLRTDGLIDDTELKAISFPCYYRTMKEMCDGVDALPNLKVNHTQRVKLLFVVLLYIPYKKPWHWSLIVR